MRKAILIFIAVLSMLSAQQADSSVTKVNINDVKYYNVVPDDMYPGDEQIRSEKPFALIQPNDKWFSRDKWMHLTSAYFLTLQSTYTLENMFFTEAENSRNISIGISLSFSLGKEFYDVFQKKGIFSWKDLFYDALGCGLGYLTASALQK